MYIIAYLLTYSFYCIPSYLIAIVSCLIPPTGKSCESGTGALCCYDGLPCILIAIFREILQQIFKYTHCEFRSIHHPYVTVMCLTKLSFYHLVRRAVTRSKFWRKFWLKLLYLGYMWQIILSSGGSVTHDRQIVQYNYFIL
jgi:hypothetical protein